MVKVKVLNQTWKVYLLSDKAHGKKFGSCHAIALIDENKIYVRKSSLNEPTVIHELTHAYAAALSLTELELDEDQMEEFFCELFSRHGEQIIKDAKDICQKLS